MIERVVQPADRVAADELPDESIEGAEFLLDLQEVCRVDERRSDFQTVADDTLVGQEADHVAVGVAGDAARVEPVKRAVVVGAFA